MSEYEVTLQDGVQVGGGGTSIVAWYPSVSEEGDISWMRSTTTEAPTPTNIKGAKGDTGEQGEQGAKGDTGEAGADGLGIKSVDINAANHLIITYDDDTTHDAGEIRGGGGGGGTVDSVSVNGSTPVLPDSNGNVDLDIVAYASNNTMYIAAIEDGDGVIYPND